MIKLTKVILFMKLLLHKIMFHIQLILQTICTYVRNITQKRSRTNKMCILDLSVFFTFLKHLIKSDENVLAYFLQSYENVKLISKFRLTVMIKFRPS